MDPISPNNEGTEKSSASAIVGILVIIIIIIAGALYFWTKKSTENQSSLQNQANSTSTYIQTATSSIEDDLSNVNLDELDADLNSL